MTSYQESYEKMSTSKVAFLLSNAKTTATLPGYAGYLATIQSTLTQILTEKVQQEADKSGDTKAKNLIKTTLISEAIDVGRRIVAYASNNNKLALLALVNYTESDLKKSTESNLVSICQVIKDNATANLTVLAPFGVTAAILTTLQTSITDFNAYLPKNRVGQIDTGEATSTLNSLFKTLSSTWAKIDVLIETLRISLPIFYSDYVKVSKIIVKGKSKLSLKIVAINAETNKPEANVKIILTHISDEQTKNAAQDVKKTLVKKTAKGGGAQEKNVTEGSYLYTAKKAGCKDINGTVDVVDGEMTVLKLIVEKAETPKE